MSKHNDVIDGLLLSTASGEWQKTALLISQVFEDPAFKGARDLAPQIAARIQSLVESGKLEAKGNLRRWRDSEVRAVEAGSL
ncbi:MAG: DUF3658 domain-containing protein [Alphaproteobacteria bacterium]|nr:DUF3658 domain-containing protein [Alphaproteobacteria bacterium]